MCSCFFLVWGKGARVRCQGTLFTVFSSIYIIVYEINRLNLFIKLFTHLWNVFILLQLIGRHLTTESLASLYVNVSKLRHYMRENTNNIKQTQSGARSLFHIQYCSD